MVNNIILYSTHCPKCKILEKKLNDKHIEYVEVNDIDTMTELGFIEVPMLKINESILGFQDAIKWVNNN